MCHQRLREVPYPKSHQIPTRWSTDTVYPEGYRNVPTQQFKERPNLNDQTVPCHFPVPSDTGCAHPRVPLFIT